MLAKQYHCTLGGSIVFTAFSLISHSFLQTLIKTSVDDARSLPCRLENSLHFLFTSALSFCSSVFSSIHIICSCGTLQMLQRTIAQCVRFEFIFPPRVTAC